MEGGVVEDVQGGVSLQMRDVQEHGVEDMQEVDVIGDASVLQFAGGYICFHLLHHWLPPSLQGRLVLWKT